VSRYVAYARLVVGAKARELYDALCEALDGAAAPGAGKKRPPVDFVGALTGLFRELAVATERDEAVGASGATRPGRARFLGGLLATLPLLHRPSLLRPRLGASSR
jgi:hypothetical protein